MTVDDRPDCQWSPLALPASPSQVDNLAGICCRCSTRPGRIASTRVRLDGRCNTYWTDAAMRLNASAGSSGATPDDPQPDEPESTARNGPSREERFSED